jgi:glycosyltransferase involved in cell wall biosynthesis
MRLGIVTGEYPPQPGGVGDYSHALAAALAARDVDVHVIAGLKARPRPSDAFSLHAVIARWSFPALLQVRGLARDLGLDWLNIQYQAAAYGLGAPIHFLPDVAGVNSVVTFHDLRIPYLFPRAGRLRAWAVTHLARSARGAVAADPADADELRRRGVRRVAHLPIGSNIAPAPPAGYDREAWRRAAGIAPADFLIGHFGFLNHSKGGDTLISALAVLAERKARARLVLIGGAAGGSDPTDAEFGAQLERLIRRHGLDAGGRLLRTGYVAAPEVSAWLLACDVVALPYRDGASLRRGTLMAALAHGCAIITTQPAQPAPELSDGETCRLVPPDSPPALVLALTGLLDAPEMRARLGAGAQTAAAGFRWDDIARRLVEFVETL